jgi:hypothetical protein
MISVFILMFARACYIALLILSFIDHTHSFPRDHMKFFQSRKQSKMGNAQSQAPTQGHGQQNRQRANGVYDGPLFGGHYAGDFSLAVGLSVREDAVVIAPLLTVAYTDMAETSTRELQQIIA